MAKVSTIIEVTNKQAKSIHRLADSLGVSVWMTDKAAVGFNQYRLFGTEEKIQALLAAVNAPSSMAVNAHAPSGFRRRYS